MKLAVARLVMILAERCMTSDRREWSLAMLGEFDEATEAGEPLSFAFGCLLTAWREMPTRAEGRFIIASYCLALGVFVPVAALLLFGTVTGQLFLAFEQTSQNEGSMHGIAAMAVNEGNRAGLPSLTALTAILGIGHLHVAWAMLDRHWTRVLRAGRIAAAIATTSAIFTGILFLQVGDALPQALTVFTEFIVLCTLVQWHGELFDPELDDPRTSFCLGDQAPVGRRVGGGVGERSS